MRPFKDFTLSKKYPALHESLPERHPCKHHIPLSAKVCNEWKFWHKSSIFVFFFSTDYYLIFVEPDLCSAHPALWDDLSTLVCGINWSTSEGPFEPVPCWHCASCMDTGCSRTAISPALRKSPKGWNPFTKKFLTFYCKVFLILFFIIFFRSFTFRFCNCFSKNHKALGSLPVCEHTPS